MNITSKELHELLKYKSISLIDIRDSFEYQNGTIEQSINIPTNDLISRYNQILDKNQTYYIFCNTGYSSSKLSTFLRNKGYTIVNLVGGYQAYKNSEF